MPWWGWFLVAIGYAFGALWFYRILVNGATRVTWWLVVKALFWFITLAGATGAVLWERALEGRRS